MNSKEIYFKFLSKRSEIIDYINDVKSNSTVNFFSISNPTLITNPFNSDFVLDYLKEINRSSNFLRSSILFYLRNLRRLMIYFFSFILYKISPYPKIDIEKNTILIDVFFILKKIVENKTFEEMYFDTLYEVLKKKKINYVFLPRLYGLEENPLFLKKILFGSYFEKEKVLFEFQVIKLMDFVEILFLIALYPFKTIFLKQKDHNQFSTVFNNSLVSDLTRVEFHIFSRYILGKRISKLSNIKKIYSWSEFQSIERCFNYGIKQKNESIQIVACQFFLNYSSYLNSIVYDIDLKCKTAADIVLTNGEYQLKKRNSIQYRKGVSLRYKSLFDKNKELNCDEKELVLLGSYSLTDTIYSLELMKSLKKEFVFKIHPTMNKEDLQAYLTKEVKIRDKDLLTLLKNASIIMTAGSGTAVEAVALGVSVIIIASKNGLTLNPFDEYGYGKIWDIVFDEKDILEKMNLLNTFRKNNFKEVKMISNWYKENYFNEPSEKNIMEAFEL